MNILRMLLLYLYFLAFCCFGAYGFYFYNELSRRETCSIMATTFEVFMTCLDQPWQDFERISPERLLTTRIGGYDE